MDIGLVNVKGYINIGSIARLMSNFPLGNIVFIDPPKNIECLTIRKYALKGFRNIKEARIITKSELKNYELVIATTARKGREKHFLRKSVSMNTALRKAVNSKSIVLFGNESNGLSNEYLELSDLVISIPSSNDYPTLNLSHAVAIILFNAWVLRNSEKKNSDLLIKEKKALINKISEIIELMNFDKGLGKKTQIIVWKRLLSRMDINNDELKVLFGFFEKLMEELRH